jgi:hypothetical protein
MWTVLGWTIYLIALLVWIVQRRIDSSEWEHSRWKRFVKKKLARN